MSYYARFEDWVDRHKVQSSLAFGTVAGSALAVWAYFSGWAWADIFGVSLSGAVASAFGWRIWVYQPSFNRDRDG